MDQVEVQNYVNTFLQAMECHIITASDGHIEVRLSEQADKDLVNRPYYWSYVEQLGIEPQPVTLSLIFNSELVPADVRGEHVTFGSPRLQQIFHSARRHGQFVRLYENVPLSLSSPRGSRPYTPWLAITYKIEWLCEQSRSEVHSLGIQLIDGTIENNFYHQQLAPRKWTPRLPNHRFVTRAKLSLPDAIAQLEFYLQGYLDTHDDAWAQKARARMEEELARLALYYEEVGHKRKEADTSTNPLQVARNEQPNDRRVTRTESATIDEEYAQRVREAKWQYEPRIDITTVNAGLFYLA